MTLTAAQGRIREVSGRSSIVAEASRFDTTAMETTRRLLQRNTHEGKIGGVAAGLADYFGIDPTIVRLAFLLLVLAGGFGIAAYLVAWLVMPAGDESTPPGAGSGAGNSRWPLGLALLAVGVVALAGTIGFWWIDEFVLWPFVLVAAGVGLLLWRRDEQRRTPLPATPTAAPSVGDTAPLPASDATEPTRVLAGQPGDALPHRGPSLPVGWITLATITLSAVIAGVLDATGALDVSARWFLVYAVGVAAVGIVAGAFFGRVLGPFVLAILLAMSLAVAWAIDVPARWSAGDRIVSPVSAAQLEEEYRLGAGELVLDLSQLELGGATRRVEASVSVGKLLVLTPPGTTIEIDGHASLGEVELYGRDENGVDVSSSITGPELPSELDRLQLDLEVGIGSVEVR
jgi:phage shock protein PspC (stress-responsive transcriptional regulator)